MRSLLISVITSLFSLLFLNDNIHSLNSENAWNKTAEVKVHGFAELNTRISIDTTPPPLHSYSGFDFIPGEKIVFFDDFSRDHNNKLPSSWNSNGSVEVVTGHLYSGHWMKFEPGNAVWTDTLLDLPENYTVEFDVIPMRGREGQMTGYGFRLMQSMNALSYERGEFPGKAGFAFSCEYFGRAGYRTYFNTEEQNGLGISSYKDDSRYYQEAEQKYHISIWVQNSRVRLYLNENKLFDLHKAFPATSVKINRLRFEDGTAMISNVLISAGVPDMRNKLLTEGKMVSYGIYFDANKDIVKPESYGTLKEIAMILKDNPDLGIKIICHTDAGDSDAGDTDLSKRRAISVKNELVNSFLINGSGIETEGKGNTQPLAANNTPLNRALNRRVEFIKQ